MKTVPCRRLLLVAVVSLALGCRGGGKPLEERVSEGYADSGGVKIHYVTLGHGPLVVLLHGFPDFWLTWYEQMDELARNYTVVAVDLRGYNLSDKPAGAENYTLPVLAGDVAAVIRALGQRDAIVVGHDWGGQVAWVLASYMPEMVHRLILVNSPHPKNILRELLTNADQQRRSEYAQKFLEVGTQEFIAAHPDRLVLWAKDEKHRQLHLEALKRSSFAAMFNYYVANYPKRPYTADETPMPRVRAPVLMIHGLEDAAFAPETLNGTWQNCEKDFTLVVIPGAGHFVQHDVPERVTATIESWLARK